MQKTATTVRRDARTRILSQSISNLTAQCANCLVTWSPTWLLSSILYPLPY